MLYEFKEEWRVYKILGIACSAKSVGYAIFCREDEKDEWRKPVSREEIQGALDNYAATVIKNRRDAMQASGEAYKIVEPETGAEEDASND